MLHKLNQLTAITTMIRLAVFSVLIALAFAGKGPYVRSTTPTLDGRIVGGKDTTIEEHPYQVSFQVAGGHYCGGSLIKPNIVVTAAHCTEGLAGWLPQLTVRAGSTRHNTGGQVINVASIHDHPKYNPGSSLDYDCSVLVLKGSFSLNAAVQLISLQSVNNEVSTGTNARVTGWGALKSGGSGPVILQAVDVPKLEQNTCQNNYPRETISDRMHCFGYQEGGKDACQGDSGGPLAVAGKLAGIVSWGYGCAFENLPGVYAKVANKEIADHINGVAARFA